MTGKEKKIERYSRFAVGMLKDAAECGREMADEPDPKRRRRIKAEYDSYGSCVRRCCEMMHGAGASIDAFADTLCREQLDIFREMVPQGVEIRGIVKRRNAIYRCEREIESIALLEEQHEIDPDLKTEQKLKDRLFARRRAMLNIGRSVLTLETGGIIRHGTFRCSTQRPN